MPIQDLLIDNPFLKSLKKLDVVGQKLSSVKKTVAFLTDESSAINSDALLASFMDAKNKLPVDAIDIKKAKQFHSIWFNNLDTLIDFFANISGYEVDDKHAKKLVNNLKEAQEIAQYIVDYMDLVIKSLEAVESIEKEQKAYTFEELDHILKVA